MLVTSAQSQKIIEQSHQAININTQPIKKDESWLALFTDVGFTDIKADAIF